MSELHPHPDRSDREFRWYQYRLRSLLLLTAITAAWLGWICHDAHRQCAAVTVITAAGGDVVYNYDDGRQFSGFGYGRHAIKPAWQWPGKRWMRKWIGCDYVDRVVCVDFPFTAHLTDTTLRHVGMLRSLQVVNLYSPAVTDAGLSHLRTLTELQRLTLANTAVTDEGVKGLQQTLPNCKIKWYQHGLSR